MASGQPFEAFLDEHVLGPLGMDETGWSVAEPDLDRLLKQLEPVELTTGVHHRVSSGVAELGRLRQEIHAVLAGLGKTAAVAGTHPFAVWDEMVVAPGARGSFSPGSRLPARLSGSVPAVSSTFSVLLRSS